jgi:lipopolysaccharide transport protein LptA
MALSRPTSLFALLACALATLAVARPTHAAATASATKCTEATDVKAESFDADYKSNTTQLRNVVISQCDIRVEAKHASATGLNFDNTRWTFDGDVRVNVENRGSLRSDQAVVDFRNNQIAKVTITGAPAEFEQRQAEANMTARGHAGEIIYDVGPGTVRLSKDAWLKYGATEMKGCSLIYNIRLENVQGGTQPCGGTEQVQTPNERVHIRITPKQKNPATPPKTDGATPPSGSSSAPATPPSGTSNAPAAPTPGAAPSPSTTTTPRTP